MTGPGPELASSGPRGAAQLYAYLPPDEHPAYDRPCPDCDGAGLTGERYEMAVTPGRPVLLVDVLCPACTGCGNGDRKHRDCPAAAHAYPDDDEPAWDGPDDGPAPYCYSCGSGRGWNAVQGFGEDPLTMVVMRVPCGCAEDRLVVTDAP